MSQIQIARLCRLYQKVKKGSDSALYSLKNMGLKGNKLEVLRQVELILKKTPNLIA